MFLSESRFRNPAATRTPHDEAAPAVCRHGAPHLDEGRRRSIGLVGHRRGHRELAFTFVDVQGCHGEPAGTKGNLLDIHRLKEPPQGKSHLVGDPAERWMSYPLLCHKAQLSAIRAIAYIPSTTRLVPWSGSDLSLVCHISERLEHLVRSPDRRRAVDP